MQDEDRAMLRRQPSKGTIEEVPVVDRDARVGAARSVDRQDPDPTGPPPMAAQLLVTGVDEEPVQPRRETVRVAQPRELAPGDEECLLNDVLGSLDVAQNSVRDRVAQVTVEVDQLRKGDVVALPSALDQPRPHWAGP